MSNPAHKHRQAPAPSPCEVAGIPGVEVSEASAADYLEAVNGRAKLEVPAVRGEHKVPMRGTVPTEWSVV